MPGSVDMTQAKNFEVLGAGYGVLSYNGEPLDLISNFQDSGQPALGDPIDVITINDQRPRCIIPPMAVSSGTLTFTTYGLKEDGVWGTVFNGRFKTARDLVDLFNQQLELGAITINWITVDLDGTPTKCFQYSGLVVTDARKNLNVNNKGARTAEQTFTCKYTRVTELTNS